MHSSTAHTYKVNNQKKEATVLLPRKQCNIGNRRFTPKITNQNSGRTKGFEKLLRLNLTFKTQHKMYLDYHANQMQIRIIVCLPVRQFSIRVQGYSQQQVTARHRLID